MLHLGVFVSGRGSNFRSIHEAILRGRLHAEIRLVVCSKPDAGAVEYAGAHGLPVFIEGPPASRDPASERALLSVLGDAKVDFIALCGYLRLIPSSIVRAFAERITNIHPALLPSFGGKGMYGHHVHEAVLASGAKVSGATVHLVSDEYDSGPIVMQRVVEIHDDDTPDVLASRVLEVEHAIYPEALELFARHRIRVAGRRTFVISQEHAAS